MKELLDLIKPFLLPKLIGWTMKVLSGVFLTLGVESAVQTTIVDGLVQFAIAAVTFGIGWLISLIQNKKAIMATPPPPTQ